MVTPLLKRSIWPLKKPKRDCHYRWVYTQNIKIDSGLEVLNRYLEKTGLPVISKFRQPTLEEQYLNIRSWLICPLLGKKEL